MLAKSWKRIGLILLIIACMWNIVSKLVSIISFDAIIEDTKAEIQELKNEIKK